MMNLIRKIIVKLFLDEDKLLNNVKHSVAVLMEDAERKGFMDLREDFTFHTDLTIHDSKCKITLDENLSRVDNLLCELKIPWM